MNNLMNRFRRIARVSSLGRDDRGLSTVEYVIVLVLIAAASVATWNKLGGTVKGKLETSKDEIATQATKDVEPIK